MKVELIRYVVKKKRPRGTAQNKRWIAARVG